MYLLSVLLLLWLPGCSSDKDVWGTGHVSYEENSSATVECHYAPGWESYVKWWCRGASWHGCTILVNTKSMRKKGHVSIQDNTQKRMFTVTIKNIGKKDEDIYWCGIERVGTDPGFQIKVTIFPATTTVRTTTTTTSTTTMTMVTTTTENSTGMENNSSERFEITDLEVLLPIIFGILLVMLVGASILAWRMILRHRKAILVHFKNEGQTQPVSGPSCLNGDPPGQSTQNFQQAPQPTEEGICYANLTLHQRTARDSPPDSPKINDPSLQVSSRDSSVHKEVEYVTMVCLKGEDISYATLSLDTPDQNPTYCNIEYWTSRHPRRNSIENTEYSLLKT